MQKFIGTITFDKKVDFDEKNFQVLKISEFDKKYSYLVFGEINVKSGEELVDYFLKKANIIDLDISLENEDKIQFFIEKLPKEGNYESASFEGELVNFEEIIERFEESYEIICIRETEISEKFGNKIIKAEFIY